MGTDFYISCFFLAIIYLSTVCLIILFVPKWDIYENQFSDNRKWYSLSYISEFLGKCLVKLLYLTLLIGIIYLSSKGVAYYKQPTINNRNLSSGLYNYSDTLMLCTTSSISYYTIKNKKKTYVPTRKDTCIYCGCRYWEHHKTESESERDIRFFIIQGLATDP